MDFKVENMSFKIILEITIDLTFCYNQCIKRRHSTLCNQCIKSKIYEPCSPLYIYVTAA